MRDKLQIVSDPRDTWEKLYALGKNDAIDEYEREARYEVLASKRNEERLAALPRLSCCDNGREFVVVSGFGSPNASWYLYLGSVDRMFSRGEGILPRYETVSVDRCPFCMKPTPDLRLKSPPPEHVVDDSDGVYCDTCGERLHGCYCDDAESRWEVVT